MAEKDTDKIEVDIVTLHAKISGAQLAHEKLTGILNNLQKEKATELRSIGRTQSEQAEAESLAIAAKIYSIIVESGNMLPELKAKNAEYIAALIGSKAANVRAEGRNLNELALFLEREIPKILAGFPASIRADRKFPNPRGQGPSLRK